MSKSVGESNIDREGVGVLLVLLGVLWNYPHLRVSGNSQHQKPNNELIGLINMNNIDLSKPDSVAIATDSIILKFSLLGCVGLALVGWGIFTITNHQNGVKLQQQATGKTNKIQTSTKPSDPPLIITKKPNKPIVIEEGSKAYYCIKNNGGPGCLTRDRFAPNYQIVAPPERVKTYEDYLIEYGVRESGFCDRYFNGVPNC